MHTFTRSSATILTVSIVLALLLVLNYSSAQWQPAPANPPANNVAAPINVGPQNQDKVGDIAAGEGRIGANQFVAFDRMRSDQYCDLSGENCTDAASVGSGGAWDFVSEPIVYSGAGQNYTVNTGFTESNAEVQIDMIALTATGGFNRGDIIHNISPVTNAIADTYRNQDSGVLVYSKTDNTVTIHVHSQGIMITPPNTFRSGQALVPGQWAFVVRANEGIAHAGALSDNLCTAYGC